jgi:hypothetical protein
MNNETGIKYTKLQGCKAKVVYPYKATMSDEVMTKTKNTIKKF